MSDKVSDIIDEIKGLVHEVGAKVVTAAKDALQEGLHIPDNLSPLLTTMKDLVETGKKFAAGEGNTEELTKLTANLGSFSAMVDKLENGPVKKMVLTLRDQAVAQLQDVKGAEKVLKILAVLGEKDKDGADVSASGGAAAPVVEAVAATPAAPTPAASTPAPVEPTAPVAAVETAATAVVADVSAESTA